MWCLWCCCVGAAAVELQQLQHSPVVPVLTANTFPLPLTKWERVICVYLMGLLCDAWRCSLQTGSLSGAGYRMNIHGSY